MHGKLLVVNEISCILGWKQGVLCQSKGVVRSVHGIKRIKIVGVDAYSFENITEEEEEN